jgi:hypothetical protein
MNPISKTSGIIASLQLLFLSFIADPDRKTKRDRDRLLKELADYKDYAMALEPNSNDKDDTIYEATCFIEISTQFLKHPDAKSYLELSEAAIAYQKKYAELEKNYR